MAPTIPQFKYTVYTINLFYINGKIMSSLVITIINGLLLGDGEQELQYSIYISIHLYIIIMSVIAIIILLIPIYSDTE